MGGVSPKFERGEEKEKGKKKKKKKKKKKEKKKKKKRMHLYHLTLSHPSLISRLTTGYFFPPPQTDKNEGVEPDYSYDDLYTYADKGDEDALNNSEGEGQNRFVFWFCCCWGGGGGGGGGVVSFLFCFYLFLFCFVLFCFVLFCFVFYQSK